MISARAHCFKDIRETLEQSFRFTKPASQQYWQGSDVSKIRGSEVHELVNVMIDVPRLPIMREPLDWFRQDVKPNLPWADDHFEERVCGEPLNPGKEWANWPWGNHADKFRDEEGQFNHNYMERYWPKYAGMTDKGELANTNCDPVYMTEWGRDVCPPRRGIRNPYGDLRDIVKLLVEDPYTRQAYLPIFFPEDTGLGTSARKPCTLGYHFMMRERRLNIFYPMRSCDYFKHFNDDIYLTLRLGLWVINECAKQDPEWNKVKLGSFSMWIGSLHLFVNDFYKVTRSE